MSKNYNQQRKQDNSSSSSGDNGFGLGSMLLAAGLSAAAGAALAYFTIEDSTGHHAYPHNNPNNSNSSVPLQPPSDCYICYDGLGLRPLEQLPCGHLFHHDCLWRWLSDMSNPNCPVCRHNLTTKQYRIYEQRRKQ